MNQLTPNLIVDAIEPCLDLWVRRLGFTRHVEVPHGDELGFVILTKGKIELMLQTRKSLADDVPPLATEPLRGCLYIEVEDLAQVRSALSDLPRIVPDRRTFYGADETLVRDPSGNVLVFAHRAAQG